MNESHYLIDDLWCSIGIKPRKREYSLFREVITSDHRVLWLEFNLVDRFGTTENIQQKVMKLKK